MTDLSQNAFGAQGNTLFLLRHGQIRPDPIWRYTGQREVSLAPVGREQARQWTHHLAHLAIPAIWTSPLARCLESARILGSVLHCPVIQEPALKEIALGEWEGLNKEEVQRIYPGAYEERGQDMAGYRPPKGESFQDLLDRVRPFAQEAFASRPLTLAVTHAGVIRVLSCWATQNPLQRLFDFSPVPGSMTVIQQAGNSLELIQFECMP
mgnify:CR=1 FL=1